MNVNGNCIYLTLLKWDQLSPEQQDMMSEYYYLKDRLKEIEFYEEELHKEKMTIYERLGMLN